MYFPKKQNTKATWTSSEACAKLAPTFNFTQLSLERFEHRCSCGIYVDCKQIIITLWFFKRPLSWLFILQTAKKWQHISLQPFTPKV